MLNLTALIISLSIPAISVLIVLLAARFSKVLYSKLEPCLFYPILWLWLEHVLIAKLLLLDPNKNSSGGFVPIGQNNVVMGLTIFIDYLIISAFIYLLLLIFIFGF